ncbi:hypothetical protein Tsubulata_039850 [Turnera subulata]|uniref:Uncharacterized protein n=1 Tax=Turnera subulata TaxID=218843 RepID=A0A9Q0GAV5_9ROSI|nr:hypothetical protein Tsubulata_039850 [Turnera subulata]
MRNAPLPRLPSFPPPLLRRRSPTTSTSKPSHSFAARRFSAQSVITRGEEFLDSLDRLLQKCSTLLRCTEIHARVIVTAGNCCSAFLAARIVSVYARLGSLSGARKVFGAAAPPLQCASNLLLWNSILRANVSHGCYEDAVRLYVKMRKLGVLGDGFTYPLVLKACGYMGGSSLCKIVHGHVTEMGFGNHLHVGNELMGVYANLGRMGDACKVFDRMGLRTLVSWNIMISGYASNCDCDGALGLFRGMESHGLVPNLVTWTSLLSSHARSGYHEEALELFGLMRMRGVGVNAEALAVVLSTCGELCALDGGMVIHGYVIKGGFDDYSFVKNALIGVYGKGGDVNGVWNLFLEIENKTIVSWNALIASLAESGYSDEAYEILDKLLGSESCGLRPNVITWGAVIGVFASKGRGDASLELFRKMLFAQVRANAVTVSTVLSICAEFASLNRGREIHGYVIRASMDKNISVENGLVNMYTKCGSLKEGHLVFQAIEMKDLISWNSMIMGYGMHGLAGNAIKTFKQMVKSGYKPDAVTFIAVLSACSHAGLVSEGRRLFYQMEEEYKVEIQMEHYACMVDLLGRAGLLQEASEIMKNMAMEPNVCVWRALLNSCRMHKNTAIAEETASHIFNLNREMVGSYMLLSNIYAGEDRWEDAARVRTSAKRRGLNKTPGQSWIEVKKNVYMFTAGKNVQEGLDEVYRVLQELACQMEGEGCVDYISESMIQPECGY